MGLNEFVRRNAARTLWGACLLAGLAPLQAQPRFADLVLQHGVVLTMDGQDHVAQALAVRDGRVTAVGSDHDIAALIGPRTKVVDLAGHTATPGLIDTHAHILQGGVVEQFQIDLTRTTSIAELLAKVKAFAGKTPQSQWVNGSGWNEGILAEHRAPTLAELDAVSGGHPVLLTNVTGHYSMANSAVLALLHIDQHSKDPPAGTIERDRNGRITGVLKEGAQDLAQAIDPPPSLAQRQTAIRAIIGQMHAEGMTGVKDPSLQPDEWAAYLQLARHEGLSAHVCGLAYAGADMVSAHKALDLVMRARGDVARLPGHDLGICGVKIFMDGSAMARTAWMKEDFAVDEKHPAPTGRGYPTVEPNIYRQMVEMFTRAGVPIGTHVIGDRGIDFVVDTYAEALARTPRFGLRHSLIHAHLPGEHALAGIAMLQHRYDAGILETQPEFLWALGGALPGAFGPARSQRLMPLATYARRGILYADSSDYPVTPLPARYGLWAAVAREPVKPTYGAHPFGMAEAANVHDALRSYTIWAARQMFLEKETGSLEAGKWADIAVWDRNPYAVGAAKLKDMRCLQTFYKGKIVFRR